ncbi:MAG: Na+-transporting NADH:ubiquinone oxidoreductase, subunit NqrB [Bdellovibrionota bacterium]|nr:RnfABCDGE type electron transport complex subunit D [Deltaproteobacteria bacterium]
MKRLIRDARYFQIVFLSIFLCIGVFFLRFQITAMQCILCLVSVIASQYFFFRYFHVEQRSYQSALITGLSLCLLLRTNTIWVHPLAGVLALSSKFLIRYQQKHFFNPANFGIILSITLLPAWVSQGQWGHSTLLVFLSCMLGFVVTYRARVGWVSVQFLLLFFLLIGARNAWLGFEHKMTLHSMLNGSLLIFAFFMISDPKTNPQASKARWLHLFWVILCFAFLQFQFYFENALFWSLFISAPLIPHWDRCFEKLEN